MEKDNGFIGSFRLNNKEVKFPGYFPQFARRYDLYDMMNTITKLETAKDKRVLENTRGIIIEMQKCPKLLDEELLQRNQRRLFDRELGSQFDCFYKFRMEYSIPLLVDPNLDRITTGGYIEDFKKMTSVFTKDFHRFLKDDDRDINLRWFTNPDFIQRILAYEKKFDVDEFIAPYIAISLKDFQSNLDLNKTLYIKTKDLSKTIFGRETNPLAVMCIKSNILKAKTHDGENRYWDELIRFYDSLEMPVLIVKLSEFRSQNKDEDYDGICSFFKYLRQKTTKPILILNMNEFAYILFQEGIQLYSAMMSRSSMEGGYGGHSLPDEDRRENVFGKYYVPRKMNLVKRSDLKKLKCDCLLCKPFAEGSFQSLKVDGWNTLRIGHFLITKNNEVSTIKEEIKKNSLRAALQDMFADSKDWKNFTEFVN